MKLVKAQVQHFRNILDSTEVDTQEDVTCLVGKNESGKTAFLEALRRLNPAQGKPKFVVGRHYPAWLEKRHRRQGKDPESVIAINAWFRLEETDIRRLAERLGKGVLNSEEIVISRNYKGIRHYNYHVDEAYAISNLVGSVDLPVEFAEALKPIDTFDTLKEQVMELQSNGDENLEAAVSGLKEALRTYLGRSNSFSKLVESELSKLVPKFFYFAEYSKLPGIVDIRKVLEESEENLDDGSRTARSLLIQAGAEDEYLLNPEYEPRKRELENVANDITQDVLEYWTTNTNLSVEVDISTKSVQDRYGHQVVRDYLHVRMRDNEHMLSLPFEERSSGFQWFFSFIAAFSEYERNNDPLVILLDEPGNGLHARAQADFLRFIDERLAQRCQVIYTTHSPFMIQPGKLERARVVEDRGRNEGVIISSDVLVTDSDTVFPLQGALGYDLTQHLFLGPNNLVVEGISDHLFLSIMSAYLIENSREGLDDRWTLMPVGGVDAVPTFVALLGGKKLDFTVLVDSRREGNQKLNSLSKRGYLETTRIITVGQILNRDSGDIEDLFTPEDYLKIYNASFGKNLNLSQITGNDTLVKRIARAEELNRFDHGKPADWLLRHRDELLPSLSDQTLGNFEKLFMSVNATLAG